MLEKLRLLFQWLSPSLSLHVCKIRPYYAKTDSIWSAVEFIKKRKRASSLDFAKNRDKGGRNPKIVDYVTSFCPAMGRSLWKGKEILPIIEESSNSGTTKTQHLLNL
ncbi:hypothetical protein ACFE04_021672 [Oxalis oulophora]